MPDSCLVMLDLSMDVSDSHRELSVRLLLRQRACRRLYRSRLPPELATLYPIFKLGTQSGLLVSSSLAGLPSYKQTGRMQAHAYILVNFNLTFKSRALLWHSLRLFTNPPSWLFAGEPVRSRLHILPEIKWSEHTLELSVGLHSFLFIFAIQSWRRLLLRVAVFSPWCCTTTGIR